MKSSQTKAEVKSFNKPDEVRTFPKGKLELITIGGATIGRATFEPGWKWSTLSATAGQNKELRSASLSISAVRYHKNRNGRWNSV